MGQTSGWMCSVLGEGRYSSFTVVVLVKKVKKVKKKSGQQTTQLTTKVDRMETTRQEETAVLHNRPADREDP